ncbi:MAG: Peptidoglycan-N-acetylglucosamine deacetylase [Bacteroidota bacterium]|jgi:peptidoglycan/xylan/chitin deacetylase (PgdA/CDA1 family)
MKIRWVKTPQWVKRLFPQLIWEGPKKEKVVYLTFDDGPTPEITEWVMDQLDRYGFKATFFLIGDNLRKFPEIGKKIVEREHAIGNHTYNHWNGWQYSSADYSENWKQCAQEIETKLDRKSALFRPPYGKIKPTQIQQLRKEGFSIIMWDIITYDWDATVTPESCLNTITKHLESGSIIVFHDSKKAFGNLKVVLPKALKYFYENGFRSESLT